MEVQIRVSKRVTTLVWYVTSDRLERAKAALEKMKPILNDHGFIVEHVSEELTRR